MNPGINKKGYVILEAALFLPLLVLAIVSIVYYIILYSTIENVNYCNLEETARLASKASVVKVAPGFTSTLEDRISSENPAVNDLETTRFSYLYWDGDLSNMIAVDASYDMYLQLPMGFSHQVELSSMGKCRGFTGLRSSGDSMSFDEMESAGIWDPVWIFPSSGEKYHSATCTYVKANAKELVLTSQVKRKYDPCSLCGADTLATGSFVCCFTESGTVYHRSSCKQVDRYAVEINKQDALDKGYTSCSKCGGG